MRPTGAASGPESEGPGLGARFTFTIPVVEEAATRSAARSRRAPLTARAPAAAAKVTASCKPLPSAKGDGEGAAEGVSRRGGVDGFDGKGRDEPLLIAASVVGSQLGHLDHRGRCPPFEKQAGGSSGCPQVVDGDADQILRFRLVRRDDIERPEGVRRDAGSRGRVEDDADVAVPGGQIFRGRDPAPQGLAFKACSTSGRALRSVSHSSTAGYSSAIRVSLRQSSPQLTMTSSTTVAAALEVFPQPENGREPGEDGEIGGGGRPGWRGRGR